MIFFIFYLKNSLNNIIFKIIFFLDLFHLRIFFSLPLFGAILWIKILNFKLWFWDFLSVLKNKLFLLELRFYLLIFNSIRNYRKHFLPNITYVWTILHLLIFRILFNNNSFFFLWIYRYCQLFCSLKHFEKSLS
jgi:hypothetical protein